MMKQLDTYTYVSAMRELVASGQTVSVRIAGNSMAPFLVDTRDSICFRAPDRPFRRGDMVFYQRETGQYVMHRIARVRAEGCYLVGDAQQLLEGLSEEEIRIFHNCLSVLSQNIDDIRKNGIAQEDRSET